MKGISNFVFIRKINGIAADQSDDFSKMRQILRSDFGKTFGQSFLSIYLNFRDKVYNTKFWVINMSICKYFFFTIVLLIKSSSH
jgi:hypothetical protein